MQFRGRTNIMGICIFTYPNMVFYVIYTYRTLFFFYKNIVFRTEVGYSYFLADFRLKIFLRIFLVSGISVTRNFRF